MFIAIHIINILSEHNPLVYIYEDDFKRSSSFFKYCAYFTPEYILHSFESNSYNAILSLVILFFFFFRVLLKLFTFLHHHLIYFQMSVFYKH